jgi:hypothetical protein
MQIILNLFAAIAAVLGSIFGNTQTLQSQVLEGFRKINTSLAEIGVAKTKAQEAKDAASSLSGDVTLAKEKAQQANSRIDDVIKEIPNAAQTTLQSSKNFTLQKFNELKTSVNYGMRGVAALDIVEDTTADPSQWLQTGVSLSDIFQNGNGQYFWDVTILKSNDDRTMINGTAKVKIGGVDYTVANDEKVVVQVDLDANTISFVKIDSNYTNSVLSGLQTGLEQVKAVAEAAKQQTDANKALIADLLLTM